MLRTRDSNGWIHLLKILCLRISIFSFMYSHFSSFSTNSASSSFSFIKRRCSICYAVNYYIVQIYYHELLQVSPRYAIHYPLMCGWCIYRAHRYLIVPINPWFANKCHHILCNFVEVHLMVSWFCLIFWLWRAPQIYCPFVVFDIDTLPLRHSVSKSKQKRMVPSFWPPTLVVLSTYCDSLMTPSCCHSFTVFSVSSSFLMKFFS